MKQEILNFLKKTGSAATWNMRIEGLGESRKLLKAIKELESEGKVKRTHLSTSNNLVWELSE